MVIKDNYGVYKLNIVLPGKVNIMNEASGLGKTLLGRILNELSENYILIDYTNYNKSAVLIKSCKKDDLIIIDNYDIFSTHELCENIEKSPSTYLIFSREPSLFNFSDVRTVHLRVIDNVNSINIEVC